MSRWLIVAVIALLATVVAGVYYSRTAAVVVQAAPATRGSIREFVDERGKTRLPETHLITMPFGGRIMPIEFHEGACVTAGEVLARISSQDLDDDVAEARAAVERLDAAIVENDDTSVERTTKEQAELFAASMILTVAAAEAKLKADRSRVDYAETFLGRVQRLMQTGTETEDELDRARLSHIESEVNYRQDALVVEALKAMKSATDLLPRMAMEFITRKSLTREVLAKQKQEAQARLRQALIRQQRGDMTSPVDGVVLERAISNEQFLAAGSVVLRIGQLERLQVEADVLSEEVVRIREGFPVEIYGPAIGANVGDGVAGVVHRIYPTGFTKISSLGVEQQRVTVVVEFADGVVDKLRGARKIGVDYRVRVRIFTDEARDAVVIPRSAVFRGADGGWAVFAVRHGRAWFQPIEAGLMNDQAVQVQGGLGAGEVVVLAPESSLEHRRRVEPILRE